MKNSDRFLIGIVIGIVILVIAVLRINQPAYQSDDTAEGVAHNYLLALQLEEYGRAYGYLSPSLQGYPENAESFERTVQNHCYYFDCHQNDVSLAIEAANVNGDQARITARETVFYRAGLFDSGQLSNTFNMSLLREGGEWRILNSEDYWIECWESIRGCQ